MNKTETATTAFWLSAGQFYCDDHRPSHYMPFFFAPMDAKCAECSNNAPESYLKRKSND